MAQTEVKTRDGVWKFKGWDKDSASINGTNAEFVGTWTFSLNATLLNEAPHITASDKVLTINDTFDPLADVTAHDKEDGVIILTKDNVIKNEVDTASVGKYTVTYKVTDKMGASYTKSIIVAVKEKTVIPQVPEEQEKSSPNTSDTTSIDTYLITFFIGLGLCIGLCHRKRLMDNKTRK